jgi:hypothetical protein
MFHINFISMPINSTDTKFHPYIVHKQIILKLRSNYLENLDTLKSIITCRPNDVVTFICANLQHIQNTNTIFNMQKFQDKMYIYFTSFKTPITLYAASPSFSLPAKGDAETHTVLWQICEQTRNEISIFKLLKLTQRQYLHINDWITRYRVGQHRFLEACNSNSFHKVLWAQQIFTVIHFHHNSNTAVQISFGRTWYHYIATAEATSGAIWQASFSVPVLQR